MVVEGVGAGVVPFRDESKKLFYCNISSKAPSVACLSCVDHEKGPNRNYKSNISGPKSAEGGPEVTHWTHRLKTKPPFPN